MDRILKTGTRAPVKGLASIAFSDVVVKCASTRTFFMTSFSEAAYWSFYERFGINRLH
jgi:hypothetical protein